MHECEIGVGARFDLSAQRVEDSDFGSCALDDGFDRGGFELWFSKDAIGTALGQPRAELQQPLSTRCACRVDGDLTHGVQCEAVLEILIGVVEYEIWGVADRR